MREPRFPVTRRVLVSLTVLVLLVVACSNDDEPAQPPSPDVVVSAPDRASAPDVEETPPVTLPTVRPGAGHAIRSGYSPGYGIVTADDETLERDLDGMDALGGCWVRVDFDWSRIEPEQGRLDWSSTDRLVREIRERDLHVLALIGYTPSWARPEGTSDKHPPVDPEAFARFAAAAVERYADRVRVWEIWNEPNIRQFWESPDADAYTDLLIRAVGAMRGVDEDVHVLSAGLSPTLDEPETGNLAPTTFLRRFLELGGGEHVDAIAMHPYSYPADPTEAARENNFSMITPRLRQLLVEHGHEDLLVWGTEFGAPTGTNPRAVPPEVQARHLEGAYRQWEDWDWTGPLLWYSWRDRGSDLDDVEDNFGLLHKDGSPKPAAEAFDDWTAADRDERC